VRSVQLGPSAGPHLRGRRRPEEDASGGEGAHHDVGYGDGQQAFFSELRLWRLDGARRRVILEGTNAYDEIFDVDSGRILLERYDDGRLVLLDSTGRVLHVFSPGFECCRRGPYALSGNELLRQNDAGTVEIFDISTEALTGSLGLVKQTGLGPTLAGVEHGFALYGSIEGHSFHVLNIASSRDTLIRTRSNDFSAALGPDGVYYTEQLQGRGRVQLLTYAQLGNP
jgi:hypothetical protein